MQRNWTEMFLQFSRSWVTLPLTFYVRIHSWKSLWSCGAVTMIKSVISRPGFQVLKWFSRNLWLNKRLVTATFGYYLIFCGVMLLWKVKWDYETVIFRSCNLAFWRVEILHVFLRKDNARVQLSCWLISIHIVLSDIDILQFDYVMQVSEKKSNVS